MAYRELEHVLTPGQEPAFGPVVLTTFGVGAAVGSLAMVFALVAGLGTLVAGITLLVFGVLGGVFAFRVYGVELALHLYTIILHLLQPHKTVRFAERSTASTPPRRRVVSRGRPMLPREDV